jgi:hypothetical protein
VSSLVRERNNYLTKSLKYALVCTQDSPSIIRINVVDKTPVRASNQAAWHIAAEAEEARPEREQLYQFFDESYLAHLATSVGWPRDKGVVELIPIVVGIGSV